jgi:hypothetical protein
MRLSPYQNPQFPGIVPGILNFIKRKNPPTQICRRVKRIGAKLILEITVKTPFLSPSYPDERDDIP